MNARLRNFPKKRSGNQDLKKCTRRMRTRDPMITSRTLSPLDYQLQLPNRWKILAIYALTLLMYTVASPYPDPNRTGGGQLPNPNECNSTLTSGTKNIYPYPTDVNDRGHRLRIILAPHRSDLIQHVVIPWSWIRN